MRYLLGTGYFFSGSHTGLDWFAPLWLQNTLLFADPSPERIVVISVGNSRPPFHKLAENEPLTPILTIDLPGNLGHVHQLIGKSEPVKQNNYCGVTGAFIVLSAIAYANECDFIYKEQDCLAFGPWIKQLYDEIGPNGGMIFGRTRCASSAQSLFLIKHWYIPAFINNLIAYGTDRDSTLLPEDKFTRMARSNPNQVRQFSFGYDRDRPFRIGDRVWYGQKFTPAELQQIIDSKLIAPQSIPEVRAFTNDITDRFPSNGR